MLTLTDNAATVVKTIVSQTPEVADGGLRIDKGPEGGPDLAVSVVPAPLPGDAIVDSEGARVFLEGAVALTLDDKVLDAQVGDNGKVTFALGVQD